MATRGCHPERAARVDQLLNTLDDHVRREVVNYFENHATGPTAQLETLLDYLDGQVAQHERDQLSTQLVHNHLPKLETRGWLDYDRRTGTVRYYSHDTAGEILVDVAAVFES